PRARARLDRVLRWRAPLPGGAPLHAGSARVRAWLPDAGGARPRRRRAPERLLPDPGGRGPRRVGAPANDGSAGAKRSDRAWLPLHRGGAGGGPAHGPSAGLGPRTGTRTAGARRPRAAC